MSLYTTLLTNVTNFATSLKISTSWNISLKSNKMTNIQDKILYIKLEIVNMSGEGKCN